MGGGRGSGGKGEIEEGRRGMRRDSWRKGGRGREWRKGEREGKVEEREEGEVGDGAGGGV